MPAIKEGPMRRTEEGAVLLKREATSSTYEILLRKAREEGRVGGKFLCLVCGMRYNEEHDSMECCKAFAKSLR